MPSKNDISGLLKKPEKKETILPEKELKAKPATKAAKKASRGGEKKRIGRPPKSPEEKRDFKVVLSLTQAEGQQLLEKAGLVDKATYVYSELKKQGLF